MKIALMVLYDKKAISILFKVTVLHVLNYLVKMFVIYFMNHESTFLYNDTIGINDSLIDAMSIEELFDLRHDLLQLMQKLELLLKDE